MAAGSAVIETAEQLAAITHPTRLRVLDALRIADSAASAARRLGEPRQRINHHVRELASAGLLVEAGERRKGNFVEQLYESVAGTFILSPRLMWGDRGDSRRSPIGSRSSISSSSAEARSATATLLDREFDGEQIPSAAVEATVLSPTPGQPRSWRVRRSHARLVERYAAGDTFTVGLACTQPVKGTNS
jgi:DNA-binding transcriptional ArsR family regulator